MPVSDQQPVSVGNLRAALAKITTGGLSLRR